MYRWDFSLSFTHAPTHVLTTYRSILAGLRSGDFIWQPYNDVINNLPNDCISGQALWRYHGWLVCWNIVEPHPIDRVARQLGFVQHIPDRRLLMEPQTHVKIHAMKKTGRRDENWLAKNAEYIAEWNDRLHNLWQFNQPGNTTVEGYMMWYYDRTVLCITNPGHERPPNRCPDWGSQVHAYVSIAIYIFFIK